MFPVVAHQDVVAEFTRRFYIHTSISPTLLSNYRRGDPATTIPQSHYLIIASFPFFTCPALFVIIYIYTPLAIGSPSAFLTSQLNSPAGVSFSSSYNSSPAILNIFICVWVVKSAKNIFLCP